MSSTIADRKRIALAEFSTDDLSYIIGRYCGSHNVILCYKKFGFILTEADVFHEILERTLLG